MFLLNSFPTFSGKSGRSCHSGKPNRKRSQSWHLDIITASRYLLAMVDYLSCENDLPICDEYSDIRSSRLCEPIYPSSVIAMSAFSHSDQPKQNSYVVLERAWQKRKKND